MCGIAGWLGTLPNGDRFAGDMAKSLHHRGPDAYGIRSWPDASLVHTRLSIIDLSSNGSQPMSNEDGTVWTSFNGEIYNHQEIQRGLQARGHIFKGRSDTEIIPHLYEEEGAEFVRRLRGMFALAVYDSRNRRLLLARDRFGIKPLFYAPGNHRIVFASEIRALLNLPGIDSRPNRQAIYDLAALFYIPAPATFYAGIQALQPGEILEARLGPSGISWKTQTYHRWSITPDSGLSLVEAADRAEELLNMAVRRQTESDVPLGSLLSGGIDSSLISVLAQEALNGKLQTFNVRFSDKEYDETRAAVTVAKSIRSNHETLEMNTIQGTWDHITSLLLHAGQPFGDTSIFPVNAISRLMRSHVTVALSGDGGDEGFAGYDVYWRIARIVRWQTLPESFGRTISMIMAPLASINVLPERLPRRLSELIAADNTTVIQSLFCMLDEAEHRKLCYNPDLQPIRRLFEPQWEYLLPKQSSRLELLSAHATELHTRLTLPNDFLFKVDTASMKESLEIRVPMLDEELFTFGLSLPHHLKVIGKTCKRILRAVAARKLGTAIANKPKCGFGVPIDSWVNNDFKIRLKETLLDSSSGLSEFFRPEFYKPMVEAFCDGRSYPGISRRKLYQTAIMLFSVHLTLKGASVREPVN